MRLIHHAVLFLSVVGVVLSMSPLEEADIREGDCIYDRLDNEHRTRFKRAVKRALEGEAVHLCASYHVAGGWVCFAVTVCGIKFKGQKMVLAILHALGPAPQCEKVAPEPEVKREE